MRARLDTHSLLWFCTADPKLPAAFRDALRDTANEVFVSVASIWEAVIKYHAGKLALPSPPAEYLPRQRVLHGFASLPIEEGVMAHLAGLPLLHRDPFDRVIVAQALQHGLVIATVDPQVIAYGTPTLPAA